MRKDHSSMPSRQPINQLLRRLWRHVSMRRRKQFGLLLVLMVLASFAEILSIGSVLPFLGVLTAPDRVFGLPLAQPFIQIAGLTSPGQLLLPGARGELRPGANLPGTRGGGSLAADPGLDPYHRNRRPR